MGKESCVHDMPSTRLTAKRPVEIVVEIAAPVVLQPFEDKWRFPMGRENGREQRARLRDLVARHMPHHDGPKKKKRRRSQRLRDEIGGVLA